MSTLSVGGSLLPAEYLRRILNYDPETGAFTWAEKIARKVVVGSVAGSLNHHGYIHISIGGRPYPAHRLAFVYMTGEWPVGMLDHRDTNKSNNAWANLRPATTSQNAMNTRRRSDNVSGFKGVCWRRAKGKWQARIKIHGSTRTLGSYDTPEAAHEAYVAAAKVVHGEFARAS